MTNRSPLDDPEQSSFAWDRYKRMMRWMALVTTLVLVVVLTTLYYTGAILSIHFIIATVLGIGLMMLLTAALMGLVFLSSGTGHDDSIADPLEDEDGWR